ncbi:MAG: hypothetical protein E3J86_00095 [Candidatus Thorarchaeota archaeon]|nr:MAG: hypothetical protein E3J86_00095 [Candidatus Thorarchaeota archaeon]
MTVGEASTKGTRQEEVKMMSVLDAFKDYCRRASRIGIRETTLHSYAQRIHLIEKSMCFYYAAYSRLY